ncbi:D-serine ammonia-lyase [Aquibacillus sediminis]|uniref:D-serine ammonia-lyase n=1 Tax=Aquibacillus sediminis TaxID=2574734 RepID=UPI0011097A82|nr:D-serine ammonia-lyase [Aquibacillus sediminis]
MAQWVSDYPILKEILSYHQVTWANPHTTVESLHDIPVKQDDITDAMARWERFAPFLSTISQDVKKTAGKIDSSLKEIAKMKTALIHHYKQDFPGRLFLKCDHFLPLTGSIKARGGIYEILKFAETIAIEHELLTKHDNYQVLNEARFKDLFSKYTIGVGSTGNLALSIGYISAKIGFRVNVYMSKDAKQWKKDSLRKQGVNVVESAGDYNEAVAEGRKLTNQDPNGYFVDDENSIDLFLGYSTAALQLKEQLTEQGIRVDEENPLYVYLPCGVGGAPGGITFGLKSVFGPHVHCYFAEPTHAPSMLLGLLTGAHHQVHVNDFGIDGITAADGLAVGRASRFASNVADHLVDGIYTIEDKELYKLVALLTKSGLDDRLELSASASLLGPTMLPKTVELSDQATHIAWSTGGGIVPANYFFEDLQKGKKYLSIENT